MPEQMEAVEVIAGLSPEIKCKDGHKCFVCQTDLTGQIGRRAIIAPLEENDNEAQILMCLGCADVFALMTINHTYAVLKIMPELIEEEEEGQEAEEEGEEVEAEPEDDGIIQMPGNGIEDTGQQ